MAKMITGTTSTGFHYEISQKRLKNYELVEAISEVESNPLIFPRLIKLLLGEDAEALKNHVRDEEGLVDTDQLTKEVMEIFQNQAVKN